MYVLEQPKCEFYLLTRNCKSSIKAAVPMMASIGSLSEEITIRHIANEARQLLICCMGINDENVRMAAQMQFERFSLWASNIGVFAQGPASLDHRLRAAPTAKAAVEVELEGLCERLLTS